MKRHYEIKIVKNYETEVDAESQESARQIARRVASAKHEDLDTLMDENGISEIRVVEEIFANETEPNVTEEINDKIKD